MNGRFFDHPIFNPPCQRPDRHWEIGPDGQTTRKVVESRRRAEFISPHPETEETRREGPGGAGPRQAGFPGANDPCRALRTTLEAEIDPEVWATLHGAAVSRPFPKPGSGCLAIKVINHLGDEVMKVFRT